MKNPNAGNPATHSGPLTAHPLVHAYLGDLNRTMAGAEDRVDVLNAVTEHITQAAASLPGPPTTADIREILAGLGPVERIAAASGADSEMSTQTARPGPASPWLGTPSGIIALTALVLSIVLIPLFFPLAGLALVLAVVALVRRRPQPRSAWVVAITSGVLLVVVLAIGVLAALAIFQMDTGSGNSQPAAPSPASVSVPAEAP